MLLHSLFAVTIGPAGCYKPGCCREMGGQMDMRISSHDASSDVAFRLAAPSAHTLVGIGPGCPSG